MSKKKIQQTLKFLCVNILLIFYQMTLDGGGVCGYKQQGLAKITFYEFLFYKVTTLFKKVWPD